MRWPSLRAGLFRVGEQPRGQQPGPLSAGLLWEPVLWPWAWPPPGCLHPQPLPGSAGRGWRLSGRTASRGPAQAVAQTVAEAGPPQDCWQGLRGSFRHMASPKGPSGPAPAPWSTHLTGGTHSVLCPLTRSDPPPVPVSVRHTEPLWQDLGMPQAVCTGGAPGLDGQAKCSRPPFLCLCYPKAPMVQNARWKGPGILRQRQAGREHPRNLCYSVFASLLRDQLSLTSHCIKYKPRHGRVSAGTQVSGCGGPAVSAATVPWKDPLGWGR